MATKNLIVSTGSSDRANNDVTLFQGYGQDAIQKAREALAAMEVNPLAPTASNPGKVDGSVSYSGPNELTVGDLDDSVWNPPTWDNRPFDPHKIRDFNVKEFTTPAPTQLPINIPNAPVKPNIPEPGLAPVLDDIVIADAPVLPDIPDPKQWTLNIPPAPKIVVPPFTATKPSSSGISIPDSNFSWTENPYTSGLLEETVKTIESFLMGGVGIPEEVWEALWARDNDRENRAGNKLIAEINEEWSSRGFQLPQGIQVAQVAEARQEIQSTSSGRSRDVAIKEADLNIENLRFAVTQGIAMENLRGQWFQESAARALDAAKFTVTYALETFNAQLAMYNADIQMYIAEGEIYKVEIEALITELEVYKAELEGQKLVGDINAQEIALYNAKVEGLNLIIENYTAEVQAAKVKAEIQQIEIESYKAEIMAYAEQIKALAIEFDAYATEVSAEKTKADVYNSSVQGYAATVSAYSTFVDAESKKVDVDIATNRSDIEEYKAYVEEFVNLMQASSIGLDAAVKSYDARVGFYQAQVADAAADTDAQAKELQVGIVNAQEETKAAVASAAQSAEHALASAEMVKDVLAMNAQVNGAYASAALSAVNVSLSASDSANNNASI